MAPVHKRKKLFLVGWASLLSEQIYSVHKLAKEHDILYWVRIKDVVPFEEKDFPNTLFHDYRDALAARPAPGIDASGFGIPSAKEFGALADVEAEFMVMTEKWYESWSINRRKELFYEMVRYWGGVLDMLRPDAIVMTDIPHEMYSFVLYHLAKRRGIGTIMFENVLRYDRLLMYRDYNDGNPALSMVAKIGYPHRELASLPLDIQEQYLEQTGQKEPTPKYMGTFKQEHTGWGKLRRTTKALVPFIKDGSIIERGVTRLFKLLKPSIRSEFARYVGVAQYGVPFVYVPLHYQPERTSSPQGGVFSDQMLLVKTLAASLPAGWRLLVKEHPNQWLPHGDDYTPYRYPGFYEELAKIPGVILVPLSTSTFELIEHAQAVSTISGIPAWEGLLRGKPAILFGCSWFMHAPGVYRVDSVASCRQALAEIAAAGGPSAQSMVDYLGALGDASVQGYLDVYGRAWAPYSPEEYARNLSGAISEALAT